MKTRIIFILLFLCLVWNGYSQEERINIVVIGAHPDDCDIKAGGTAVLFSRLGHNVLFISVTNGDAGHYEMGGGALARRRIAEAEEAGRRLGITYVVLDHHDGELMPSLNIRLEIIRWIRRWNADVVISHRPNDYHPDHRNASILVQDAAYMVIVPNVAPDTKPLEKNPVFLYMEDRFQRPNPFRPDISVDITDAVDVKYFGMAAHESQFFEWLPWTAGRLGEVPAGSEERIHWLKNSRRFEISPVVKENLEKWYGPIKASATVSAEAFEICEYGRRPSEDEIRRLFPMFLKLGTQ
jgi:LmbE family N-acetylglucosaminyl deacetylase